MEDKVKILEEELKQMGEQMQYFDEKIEECQNFIKVASKNAKDITEAEKILWKIQSITEQPAIYKQDKMQMKEHLFDLAHKINNTKMMLDSLLEYKEEEITELRAEANDCLKEQKRLIDEIITIEDEEQKKKEQTKSEPKIEELDISKFLTRHKEML